MTARAIPGDDYELPDAIPPDEWRTELFRFVLNLWTRRLAHDQIAVLVRADLVPRLILPVRDSELVLVIAWCWSVLDGRPVTMRPVLNDDGMSWQVVR
jgi:hypothetical protein